MDVVLGHITLLDGEWFLNIYIVNTIITLPLNDQMLCGCTPRRFICTYSTAVSLLCTRSPSLTVDYNATGTTYKIHSSLRGGRAFLGTFFV